jgi:transcriptional regulator with XRE-family HTH domain
MKPGAADRASDTRLTLVAAGERIRALRQAHNWRQADLAELVDVTQPYIGMLERGEVKHPSRRVCEALSKSLGADVFGEPTLGLVEAATYLGVDPGTLRSSPIPHRRDGHRYEYRREDLDAAGERYACAEPGCGRLALGASGGCEAHGHAMLQRGTKRPDEVRERISEAHRATHADPERGPRWRAGISRANRGRPRPDVRERVAEMHADREQRYRWGVLLAEGRAASTHPLNRPFSPNSIRRWKGRLAGLEAGRLGGAQKGYTDKHVAQARGLKKLDPKIGRVRLAKLLGITEDQARAILELLKREG